MLPPAGWPLWYSNIVVKKWLPERSKLGYLRIYGY